MNASCSCLGPILLVSPINVFHFPQRRNLWTLVDVDDSWYQGSHLFSWMMSMFSSGHFLLRLQLATERFWLSSQYLKLCLVEFVVFFMHSSTISFCHWRLRNNLVFSRWLGWGEGTTASWGHGFRWGWELALLQELRMGGAGYGSFHIQPRRKQVY